METQYFCLLQYLKLIVKFLIDLQRLWGPEKYTAPTSGQREIGKLYIGIDLRAIE